MREYKNFKEIDRDLKLLKLQKEIDKEKVKLSFNQTKQSLTPKAILSSIAGDFLRSAIVTKGTNKILGALGGKKKGKKKGKKY